MRSSPLWKAIRLALLGILVLLLTSFVWIGYKAHAVYDDVHATYHPVSRIALEPKATPVTNVFGNHRFNILVLGSDNDQKFVQKYPLTQTMIVVSVDPVHDTVSMLSIPRDFWVSIPGDGMGKIDTAAALGGVPLARATVETLFHINIDYYAWIGLAGFRHVVDDFGGVTVDVTHPILDDFYPDDQSSVDPYAYTRLFIPAGWAHLSGRQALEYVRSRHGDAVGDFGRSARQQQVLLQLQKKANGWNLVFKIPQLAHDLKSMVQTDLSPAKLLDVGRLSRLIDRSNITRVVLSAPTYCQYSMTSDGQSILMPDWRAIRPMVNKLFAPVQASSGPGPTQQATVEANSTATPTSGPTSTPSPLPAPTSPSAALLPSRLPGKLIYASAGTFYEMDAHGNVADIMPGWMNAAGMPAVSADGKVLAFIRWSREASDIYTYNLRTHAAPARITNDATADPLSVSNSLWAVWPSWSRDGKTILFSSDGYKVQALPSQSRMLDLAIYAMDANGSNVRQLTLPAEGAGGDTDPQFRGGSSQYVYLHWAYRMENGLAVGQPYSRLMIRNINNPSANAAQGLTPPSEQIVQPALDRSGNLVAYVRTDGPTSRLIAARIVNTTNGPRLRDQTVIASGEIAQPAFTPDGKWISYLKAEGDGFAIYVEPASGGPSTKLDGAGNSVDATARPLWLP